MFSLSLEPRAEPIIIDYTKLKSLALEGVMRYYTDATAMGPQIGFDTPTKKDFKYTLRLAQYLRWCEPDIRPIDHLNLLVLLLTVFDKISEHDTSSRGLLAGFVAHHFITIKKSNDGLRKTFESIVFSTLSLSIYNDKNHRFQTYREPTKDNRNYTAEMVGDLLHRQLMQYSKSDQQQISHAAQAIHTKLNRSSTMSSDDFSTVLQTRKTVNHRDDDEEAAAAVKDSLANLILTPTTLKHPVHSEPIIMDYAKLLRLAKEGAHVYLTNGQEVALAKDLEGPSEIDIVRASRFMNYLDWCYQTHEHHSINQPATLALLLAIFGTEAGHSELFAHIITRQCIRGDYKVGHNIFEDSLKSDVFSKQALSDLISDDTAELFNRVYDKQDKDKFHDVLDHPMAFRRLLNLRFMQHSENDRLLIQQNAEKLKGTLTKVDREIQPDDLPGVYPDPTIPIAPYYKLHKQSYTEKTKYETLVDKPVQVTEDPRVVRLT